MFLRPALAERCHREGIAAFNEGRPRGDNPYSYESYQCWDSGWLQAEQAANERLPLARLNAMAREALTPPNNIEEEEALAGLTRVADLIDRARVVAQKAAQAGLYNDPDVCWLLRETDRG